MTTLNATICYSEDDDTYPALFDWTDSLKDVLTEWTTNGIADTHPDPNTGGFYTGGSPSGLSGDTYGFSIGGSYAFSVCGDLSYYFPPLSGPADPNAPHNHTLYGHINKISFGGALDDDGTVIDPFLVICFDDPLYGDLEDGHENLVHDVIWGLMNASLEGYPTSQVPISQGGLLAVLDDYGINVNSSIASLGDPYGEDCDCGCDPELLGIPEYDDYLLAA